MLALSAAELFTAVFSLASSGCLAHSSIEQNRKVVVFEERYDGSSMVLARKVAQTEDVPILYFRHI